MSIEAKEEFRPKIVAFCCNWCSYAGADLAGSSRLSYPADVKIIRVPCSCRVNPMFILRAFEKGADGVIMCGCHPGDCHYTTGNYYARRRMTLLFSMLDFIGVENGRTRVEWVSAAEGVKFSQTMNEFVEKIHSLAAQGLVSEKSRVLFVNDGSKDKTWELIQSFAAQDEHYIGISQSRNRGHQNAVLAGLMEAKASDCDVTISIDCDGQDDINAMDEMVQKYLDGAEVVYGVRSRRDTDTFFKRFTAEGFYHVMNALGADIVFNHADYRLISTRVLESFADYHEVNIFLRGMVPLVGFPHDVVTYERHERLAGESHYPLSKMLALAFDGITSLSNKPIRIITGAGIVVSLIGFIGVIWAIVQAILGSSVAGWASIVCIVCFMGGVQLVCLGVIGEYIGKIYMETKARPRYIISERTWAPYERKYHG